MINELTIPARSTLFKNAYSESDLTAISGTLINKANTLTFWFKGTSIISESYNILRMSALADDTD